MTSIRPVQDERALAPADLWDQKVREGLSPDSATAYVARIHGPPPSRGVPTPGLGAESFQSAIGTQPAVQPSSLGQSLRDAALGAYQGISAGFGDELAAGEMALVNLASGKPARFRELLNEAQSQVREGAERSPQATAAGTLIGAVAGPTLASKVRGPVAATELLTPATRLARAGQVAKGIAGAGAVGGAVGFGSQDGGLRDRLAAAEEGALAGAGIGTGLTLGGALLRGPANLVRTLAPRPTVEPALAEGAAGAPAPSTRFGMAPTERLAGEGILRDIERSGLPLEEYAARARANPNLPLYDLGPSLPQRTGSPILSTNPAGDPLVRRAEGVYTIPSRGSTQIGQHITQRAEERPATVATALQRGLGVGRENTTQLQTTLQAQRAAASAPKYAAAYATEPVDDPAVLEAFTDPTFAKAYETGRRIAKAEGVELPALLTGTGKDATRNPLTVQGLDYAKQGLDDVIESRMSAGKMGKREARTLRNKLSDMLDQLDAQRPEYAEARAAFRSGSQAMEGAEQGLEFFTTSPDELDVQWSKMTDAAKENYRKTALAQIQDRLASSNRPEQILNGLTRRKLQTIATSPEDYAAMELSIRRQLQGRANDATIATNSATARRLAAQGDLLGGAGESVKSVGGSMLGVLNPMSLVGRASDAALRARLGVLTEARADAFAPFLTASGPDAERRLEYLQLLKQEMLKQQAARSLRRASVAGTVGGHAGATTP